MKQISILLLSLVIIYNANCVDQLISQEFNDQQYTDITQLDAALTWTLIGNCGTVLNTCDSKTIFGAFGTGCITRKSYDLPQHQGITIKFKLYKIDTWDSETFYVHVDGVKVYQITKQYWEGASNLCGLDSYNDEIIDVTVTVENHSWSKALIQLSSNLSEASSNESWGIREFELFANNASGDIIKENDESTQVVSEFYGTSINAQTINTWTLSGCPDPSYTNCGGSNIVGGPQSFGVGCSLQKNYQFGQHTGLKISFSFFKIDSWDSNEGVYLQIDGNPVWSINRSDLTNSLQLCGVTGWTEAFKSVSFTVPNHISTSSVFRFVTTLNEQSSNESWGFKDFTISTFPKVDDGLLVASEFEQQAKLSEAISWGFDGWCGNIISTCGGNSLFGGFGAFGGSCTVSKSYQFQQHQGLRLRFQFWKIDSWDDEYVQLLVDGVVVWQKDDYYTDGFDLCNNNYADWADNVEEVFIDLPEHTNTESTFQFVNNFNEGSDNESYGFRNWKVYIQNSSGALPQEDDSNTIKQFFDNIEGDAVHWDKNDYCSAVTTQCQDVTLFGGYGSFGSGCKASKTFQLPKHFGLEISFEFWAIDSWDWGETALLQIDEVIAWAFSPLSHNIDVCGVSGWGEQVTNVQFVIPNHVNLETLFTFSSTLDEGAYNESWGIRKLRIKYLPFQNPFGIVLHEEFSGQVATLKDAINWSFVGDCGSVISSCQENYIFGGYGAFGGGCQVSRAIELPPHQGITLKFNFWKVDSWDNETVYLEVDGFVVWSYTDQWWSGYDLCYNSGWKDNVFEVVVELPDHTNEETLITFLSNFDESSYNESFGFNNLIIYGQNVGQAETTNENVVVREFTGQATVEEANTWKTEGCWNNVSQISDIQIFGGGYAFGGGCTAEKEFSFPKHTGLKVKFDAFFMDSWDWEALYLLVDGVPVWNMYSQWGYHNINLGGNPGWGDQLEHIEFDIPNHTELTSIFTFSSTIDQGADDESWGLLNLSIEYYDYVEDDKTLILEEFTDNQINLDDAGSWTMYGNYCPTSVEQSITQCKNSNLFGGYGVFGRDCTISRSLELPTHTGLQITFTLWKIDSWDSEGVWFYVDGQEVYGVTANWWEGLNLCYNSWWYDYAYEVIIDLPDHTSTLTYFDFYNNFDEDPYNESFGITNFQVFARNVVQEKPKIDDSEEYLPTPQPIAEDEEVEKYVIPDETVQECAFLYSECGYQGEQIQLCDQIPHFTQPVKSLQVPEGKKVKIYDLPQFQGKTAVFSESVDCLETINFQMLQKYGITIENKKSPTILISAKKMMKPHLKNNIRKRI